MEFKKKIELRVKYNILLTAISFADFKNILKIRLSLAFKGYWLIFSFINSISIISYT